MMEAMPSSSVTLVGLPHVKGVSQGLVLCHLLKWLATNSSVSGATIEASISK